MCCSVLHMEQIRHCNEMQGQTFLRRVEKRNSRNLMKIRWHSLVHSTETQLCAELHGDTFSWKIIYASENSFCAPRHCIETHLRSDTLRRPYDTRLSYALFFLSAFHGILAVRSFGKAGDEDRLALGVAGGLTQCRRQVVSQNAWLLVTIQLQRCLSDVRDAEGEAGYVQVLYSAAGSFMREDRGCPQRLASMFGRF